MATLRNNFHGVRVFFTPDSTSCFENRTRIRSARGNFFTSTSPNSLLAIAKARDDVTSSEHRSPKSASAHPAPAPGADATPQIRAVSAKSAPPRASAKAASRASSSGSGSSSSSHPSMSPPSASASMPQSKAAVISASSGCPGTRFSSASRHHSKRICPTIGWVVEAMICPSCSSSAHTAATAARCRAGTWPRANTRSGSIRSITA